MRHIGELLRRANKLIGDDTEEDRETILKVARNLWEELNSMSQHLEAVTEERDNLLYELGRVEG